MSYEEIAQHLITKARENQMYVPHANALSIGRAADAQIAALTERLRIVEAERDEARNGVKKSAEAYGALMEHAEKLRTELERKDAALKEVLPWLERETPPQYVGVDREGSPVEYEPTAAEEACGMAAMVLRAALQPKEPPCQTA